MAWVPSFRLIRADDQVVLDVNVSGPPPNKVSSPTPGGPAWVFEGIPGGRQIWVQFGSQQIIEYAKPETGQRKDQADPLFVDRADLIFQVPAGLSFPATVEGLLDVLSRSPLRVNGGDPTVDKVAALRRSGLDPHELVAAVTDRTPLDGPPSGQDRESRRAAAAARAVEARARRVRPRLAPIVVEAGGGDPPVDEASPPGRADGRAADQLTGPIGTQPPSASQVPMPRRLAVRPPQGPVRMVHSAGQVTHEGRTELWHTRLAVQTTDPDLRPVEVEVPVALKDMTLDIPTPAPLVEPRDENSIRNALTDTNCKSIAPQTHPPYTNSDGSPTGAAPARLGRLMLSALGGWLRLAGTWPTRTVKQLKVDTAQGRDQLQHKVVVGRLMPFGHKAVITGITRRRFETGNTRVAGLETTTVLEVTEPFADIDKDGLQRQWPFSGVKILDSGPISGTEGELPQFRVSTFDVAGAPFRFRCEATDRSGQPVQFAIPMLFAADDVTDADAAAGWAAYTGATPPADTTVRAEPKTEYFQIQLDGQRLGVAVPPAPGNDAAAEEPIAETATTVLAKELDLTLDAGRPVMRTLTARIEGLERFAPDTGDVVVQYAKPYLDHLLEDDNKQGQVFLDFAASTAAGTAQPLVDLGGQTTGGLAQLGLPIAGLSRRFGAVAGALPTTAAAQTISDLAAGELNLGFLTSALDGVGGKLLGLVDLSALIPTEPKPKLEHAQRITTDVLDGVTRQTLTWNVPLLTRTGSPPNVQIEPLRQGFISLEATGQDPQPTEPHLIEPILTIVQVTEVDPDKSEMRSTTTCTITGLVLRVYMSDVVDPDANPPIVSIPFKKIGIVTRDGGKPDFDVVLGKIEFGGILQFVRILADLIDKLGLSDPPALEVTEAGVRSSFSFDVPAVAIGMFSLQNIGFTTALDLTFVPDPAQGRPALLLTVSFARRANPFLLTVSFLGGGGYLEIAAASDGLARIEGSLQFGAALVVNFLEVAKGSVEAMGGVIFTYDRLKKETKLTAFLQIRGEVSVLSLISLSVTLLLELSYDFRNEILSGHAEVVVEVSVWFFSQSVSIPYDWSAKTGNNDPTFAELMAPAGQAGERPWDTYCLAFAT
jgi:hypothetical protein